MEGDESRLLFIFHLVSALSPSTTYGLQTSLFVINSCLSMHSPFLDRSDNKPNHLDKINDLDPD